MVNLLLDGRSRAQKIKEAKELLISEGYVVKEPIKSHVVSTPAQMVRFFYDTMARYNPQFKMVYAGNVQKERSIAKRMLAARMELGAGKERAVAECCQLIELLFEYEPYIGLTFKVTSMGIFGLDSMSWVTEKVWQIHEGVNSRINEAKEQEWHDRIYSNQDEQLREEEIEKAKQLLDKVLERYDND